MSAALALALAPGEVGPYLQALSPTTVDVVVELHPAAAAELTVRDAAGADAGPPAALLVQSEVRDFHRFHVTGLRPGHDYAYEVRAAGSAVTAHFRTAPDPAVTPAAPFSFVVYGDSRTDPAAHAAVVARLAATPSDFLVDTGDLVNDGASTADWATFFRIEGTLLRERCLYVCVGNHELTERSGANFLAYFAPGDMGCGGPGRPCEATNELYGSFRWASTRFFLLNGMDDFAVGGEREWLESELARADAEPGLVFRIVVVHWGPFSSGPHGDNTHLHGARIPELLRQHHVDLVLSGHDHLYERGTDDGLKYMISGGGGAPLYRDIKRRPSTRIVEPTHHVVRFEVDGRQVRTTTTRADGSLVETCGFDKPGDEIRDWSCDGSDATPAGAAPSGAASAPVPPAAPSSTPRRRAAVAGARSSVGPAPQPAAAVRRCSRRPRCSPCSRRSERIAAPDVEGKTPHEDLLPHSRPRAPGERRRVAVRLRGEHAWSGRGSGAERHSGVAADPRSARRRHPARAAHPGRARDRGAEVRPGHR